MAGLMKRAGQGQQGPSNEGGMGPSQDPATTPAPGDQDESNVTPEEQAEYDQFVTNGMKLMYSEETLPKVLESIAGDGNPIEGLGTALAMLVMRVEDSAKDSGREISGDVKLNAATELLEQMAELATEAGIHDFSPEDMEVALFHGLDVYRETRAQQGELPVDELTEDMAQIVKADQQGRIDEVVPGLKEYAQKRGIPQNAG